MKKAIGIFVGLAQLLISSSTEAASKKTCPKVLIRAHTEIERGDFTRENSDTTSNRRNQTKDRGPAFEWQEGHDHGFPLETPETGEFFK